MKIKERISLVLMAFFRSVALKLKLYDFVANTRAISPMGYVIEMAAALIATAFIVPIALVYLFNLSNWEGVPTTITTLGTTVLAVFFMLGLFLKFMPVELKSKMGM